MHLAFPYRARKEHTRTRHACARSRGLATTAGVTAAVVASPVHQVEFPLHLVSQACGSHHKTATHQWRISQASPTFCLRRRSQHGSEAWIKGRFHFTRARTSASIAARARRASGIQLRRLPQAVVERVHHRDACAQASCRHTRAGVQVRLEPTHTILQCGIPRALRADSHLLESARRTETLHSTPPRQHRPHASTHW